MNVEDMGEEHAAAAPVSWRQNLTFTSHEAICFLRIGRGSGNSSGSFSLLLSGFMTRNLRSWLFMFFTFSKSFVLIIIKKLCDWSLKSEDKDLHFFAPLDQTGIFTLRSGSSPNSYPKVQSTPLYRTPLCAVALNKTQTPWRHGVGVKLRVEELKCPKSDSRQAPGPPPPTRSPPVSNFMAKAEIYISPIQW